MRDCTTGPVSANFSYQQGEGEAGIRSIKRGVELGLALMVALLVARGVGLAQDNGPLLVGPFSAAAAGGAMPAGWEPLTFKGIEKQTEYSLVRESGSVVVEARSDASASGLVRPISLDPREFPIIRWRWKVENVLRTGDVSQKKGDDYVARIYISFAYDRGKVGLFEKAKFETARLIYGEYPPSGAINYIWESKAPVGTVVPNPYTGRVKMIVVESGAEKLGTWISEERNIYADYKHAFGHEPPAISGIAIMTDTDNTGESAVAYYGDIVLQRTVP